MLIVLSLYFAAVWLIFSKLELLPWNGASKTVVSVGALVLALTVVGTLNHTTPTGRVSVQGAVINITPNVAGIVTEVAVDENMAVTKGDVLFRIDDTTQAAEVARLEAALASAEAAADRLQTDLEAAEAEIDSLNTQLDLGIQRRDDVIRLNERGTTSDYQLQEAVANIEQLKAGIRAAKARKAGLERRIAAQIDDVDAGVLEVKKALAQARWALDQTVVRAPDDGIISGVTLRVGNRVGIVRGAMNFVSPQDRVLVVSLPQSSLANVSVGDDIRVALGTMPGTEFDAKIEAIPPASREGVIDTRAGLPFVRQLSGTGRYVALMDIPEDEDIASATRLGASGTALVMTDKAGAIAPLAEVLFWITKKLNYL